MADYQNESEVRKRRRVCRHLLSSGKDVKSRRIAGSIALILLLVAALACGRNSRRGRSGGSAGGRSVPTFAIHIKAPTVNQRPDTKAVAGTLAAELRHSSILTDNYVAPEQVAAVAVSELRQGNDWDAALFLSIAGYRYHQVALRAHSVGTETALARAGRINVDAYIKHIRNEIRLFSSLDFDDELKMVSARARQEPQAQKILQEGLLKVLASEEDQRQALIDDIAAQMEQVKAARQEDIHYSDLAQNYLKRLEQDANDEIHQSTASFYLAKTPLKAYHLSGLQHTYRLFDHHLVREITPRLNEYRPQVLAALKQGSIHTRSTAAIILGLNPSEEHIAALEEVNVEMGLAPQLKLSVAFALTQHDRVEHLETLQVALSSCSAGICDHAAQLAQWLRPEFESQLDVSMIARVLAGRGNATRARYLAAVILGDIGEDQPLPPDALSALLAASHDSDDEVAEAASRAVSRLAQLDRTKVHELYQQHPGARTALLARLEEVASAEDLPFLTQQFSRAIAAENQDDLKSIIGAVGHIPGPQAYGTLIRWYENNSSPRFTLALTLIRREDRNVQQLQQLAAQHAGIGGLVLGFGTEDPRTINAARVILTSGQISDRLQAAILVGLLHQRELLPQLWTLASYSNNNYYPADAVIRNAAMGAIIRIEMAGSAPTSTSTSAQLFEPLLRRMAYEPVPGLLSGQGFPIEGADHTRLWSRGDELDRLPSSCWRLPSELIVNPTHRATVTLPRTFFEPRRPSTPGLVLPVGFGS